MPDSDFDLASAHSHNRNFDSHKNSSTKLSRPQLWSPPLHHKLDRSKFQTTIMTDQSSNVVMNLDNNSKEVDASGDTVMNLDNNSNEVETSSDTVMELDNNSTEVDTSSKAVPKVDKNKKKLDPTKPGFMDLPGEIRTKIYEFSFEKLSTCQRWNLYLRLKSAKDCTKISDVVVPDYDEDEVEKMDAPEEKEEPMTKCWTCGNMENSRRCWTCRPGNYGNLLLVSRQAYQEGFRIAYESTVFLLCYDDDLISLMRGMRSHERGHLVKRLSIVYAMADGGNDMERTFEMLRPGVLHQEFPNLEKLTLEFRQGSWRIHGGNDLELFADCWNYNQVMESAVNLSHQTVGYEGRLQVRVSGLMCPEIANSVIACVASGDFVAPANEDQLMADAKACYWWDQDLWHRRDRLRGLFDEEMTVEEMEWAKEWDDGNHGP